MMKRFLASTLLLLAVSMPGLAAPKLKPVQGSGCPYVCREEYKRCRAGRKACRRQLKACLKACPH
jgi:hypothetical protein